MSRQPGPRAFRTSEKEGRDRRRWRSGSGCSGPARKMEGTGGVGALAPGVQDQRERRKGQEALALWLRAFRTSEKEGRDRRRWRSGSGRSGPARKKEGTGGVGALAPGVQDQRERRKGQEALASGSGCSEPAGEGGGHGVGVALLVVAAEAVRYLDMGLGLHPFAHHGHAESLQVFHQPHQHLQGV